MSEIEIFEAKDVDRMQVENRRRILDQYETFKDAEYEKRCVEYLAFSSVEKLKELKITQPYEYAKQIVQLCDTTIIQLEKQAKALQISPKGDALPTIAKNFIDYVESFPVPLHPSIMRLYEKIQIMPEILALNKEINIICQLKAEAFIQIISDVLLMVDSAKEIKPQPKDEALDRKIALLEQQQTELSQQRIIMTSFVDKIKPVKDKLNQVDNVQAKEIVIALLTFENDITSTEKALKMFSSTKQPAKPKLLIDHPAGQSNGQLKQQPVAKENYSDEQEDQDEQEVDIL